MKLTITPRDMTAEEIWALRILSEERLNKQEEDARHTGNS
jgi:hypothetical protein